MELTTREPVLVHPVLTDEQALLIHQCLVARNTDPEVLSEDEGEEARLRRELADLTTFFYALTEHPENFQLRSRDDAKRIIRAAKPVRGPAQPGRKPKRKRTQERKQSFKRRTRAQKKVDAVGWNEAVQIMQREQEEAEEAYAEAMKKAVERFESIARKEAITSEELQEVLEGFGAPEAAVRVRELRAAEDPQRRLDAAADQAAASEPTEAGDADLG